jgi:hypothetical protein
MTSTLNHYFNTFVLKLKRFIWYETFNCLILPLEFERLVSMTFKKEIEQYLEQISVLEEIYRKVQDSDMLPLSFFSASIDILNKLKSGVYELESAQFQLMATHLKETEEKTGDVYESFIATPVLPPTPIVAPTETPVAPNLPDSSTGFLGDVIAKKIYADFSKSLNLNQRFMFQRDLFKGNAEGMNKALTQLNLCQRLREALDYLNENYTIQWDSESGTAFRDLLDKHFA